MKQLINLGAALTTIYQYIYWEMEEKDFIELDKEEYSKLPIIERGNKWYVINPFKLKQLHRTTLFVDENDKKELLAATKLIMAISASMPENSTFPERLQYCKAFLPEGLYKLQTHIGSC